MKDTFLLQIQIKSMGEQHHQILGKKDFLSKGFLQDQNSGWVKFNSNLCETKRIFIF